QAPDKRWDMYGAGPGPTYDWHFMLQWHRFKAALRDAKIESLTPPDEPGNYFCGATRFDNRDDILARGTKILIAAGEPTSATLAVQAAALGGGDLQATSLEVLSPGGQKLLNVDRLPMTASTPKAARSERPSTWQVAVENYPLQFTQAGLQTVLVGSNDIGV